MKLVILTSNIPSEITSDIANLVTVQKNDYILAENETDLLVYDYNKAFKTLNVITTYELIDYQLYRRILKETWGNLPDIEWNAVSYEIRYTVAANKACAKDRIAATITDDSERYRARTEFAKQAIKARQDRYEYIKSIAVDNLPELQLLGVMQDLKSYFIDNLYIQEGLEGTLYGEDYIENAVNYVDATTQQWHIDNLGLANDPISGVPYGKFATIGLRAKSLTMLGSITKDEMCDLMLEHLHYGFNRTLNPTE